MKHLSVLALAAFAAVSAYAAPKGEYVSDVWVADLGKR